MFGVLTVDRQSLVLRFAPSADARSVAVLRIVTGLAALSIGVTWWQMRAVADVPMWLRTAPDGTGWALDLVPVSSALFTVGWLVFMVAAVAVTVGWHSRSAATVAALVGLYVGWVPQTVGKVDHYHHVIWFLALLAVSPVDDALAFRLSGRRARRTDYAATTLAAVVLIGVVYLFAGTAKLAYGLDWAVSDNLRNTIWGHWYHRTPLLEGLSLVENPLVYKTLGVATILFEIGFLPLALHPRTRRWVAVAGIGFHVGVGLVMDIFFLPLLLLYPVLFAWGEPGIDGTPLHSRWRRPVTTVLVSGAVFFGTFGVVDGWPFAAYPPFSPAYQPTTLDYYLIDGGDRIRVADTQIAGDLTVRRANGLAKHSPRAFAEWSGFEEVVPMVVPLPVR